MDKPWYTSPLAVGVFAGAVILALAAAFKPNITPTTSTASTNKPCGCS